MSNTIKIKDYSGIMEERVAESAITPGMLLELTSDNKFSYHTNKDGNAIPIFAVEDELQGKTIDEDYAIDDMVQAWVAGRGDWCNAWLAQGENVVTGTFLASNGDGRLKAVSSVSSFGEVDPLEIVGMAMESVNATAKEKRIIIMVV